MNEGLGASASTMAVIEMAFGVGILCGGAVFVRYLNNLIGRFIALISGNGLLGIGLFSSAFSSDIYLISMWFFIGGAGFAIFNINASTLRAAATPSEFRSRMAAGVAFLSSCLNPLATQGVGFAIDDLGIVSGVEICGVLIILSTFLLIRNSDAKSLLSRSDEDIVGVYRELYPRAFGK
ncbi:hypothetical protein ACPWR0_21855 [Pandoraea pneumonica]|uniref:hypothetical protein n=1 Tax=Pandoraea pneumonica TaxID=2508299 RepID=UPI003CF8B91D